MRKKSSGFFILSKDRLIAGIAGLVIGIVATQLHPFIGQASAALLVHPSPSPKVDARQVDLTKFGKPHPAVPAKVSPAATPSPTPTPTPAPKQAAEKPQAAPAAPPAVPALIGSIGYAVSWGNCVNEPGVNNPGYGNPISWPALSSEPTVGATALFTWNHTGVVTGLWANGDVEVRHQNYWGGQHRFPRSMFRGFR